MKIRVVVYQCNTCRIPWQSRTWYFGDAFGRFWANSGRFCGRGANVWCRDPLLSLIRFTYIWPFNENRVVGCQWNTCRGPWQSRMWYFGDYVGRLLANAGCFCCWGATWWCRNPPVGSPDRARARCDILGMMLGVFWPIQAIFVIGESVCDVGIPSWALKPLWSFNEKRVVGCKCNTCRVPSQSRTWYFGDDFGQFFANSGHFCGRGATLWCRNPRLSPNTYLY